MIWLWLIGGVLVVCFGLVVLRGAPYVPTHTKQLSAAFDTLYRVGAEDIVVDLGSGDGVVLMAASKRGATVVGYELNPILVLLSRRRLRHTAASVHWRDYTQLRLLPAGATLVYAFTTGPGIKTIERKLREWSQGTPLYFVSYGFTLPNHASLRSHGPMHLYYFKP